MSDENVSSLGKIPTLTGTDSFVKWRRAISAYLLDEGALRVLEGREREPFRKDYNTALPGDRAVIRPFGECAGAEQPGANQSASGTVLNNAQRTAWDEWEKKERKARSTIILTVSAGIAAEIEMMWSAHEMYEHITAEHKVDTIEHRGNLIWRIQTLNLRSSATADEMNAHYEAFTNLISEAIAAGDKFEDWDKCERFFISLNDDLETLRLQFRLMPSGERPWRNLVTTYKSIAETRRIKHNRDTTVAAIFGSGQNKERAVMSR